jgi:hypothetical protein
MTEKINTDDLGILEQMDIVHTDGYVGMLFTDDSGNRWIFPFALDLVDDIVEAIRAGAEHGRNLADS